MPIATYRGNGKPPDGVSRVDGDFQGVGGVIGDLSRYFADHMVMPDLSVLAMAAWVQAAHFIEPESKGPWDQFPLLAVTSPEKRCGKSTLLDLLRFVTPRADEGKFINPSPAAFYRAIEKSRPTIVMDESQSLKRRGSESSEVLREMLNASIRRDECVVRCVGEDHEPTKFSIYSPKIFAQIGDPDGVLADRCLPVRLERKTDDQVKTRFSYRRAKERGEALRVRLDEWAILNLEEVTGVYERLEPFDIRNDRMADLLMPLQCVMEVAGGSLESYARWLDQRDRDPENQSFGVRLLTACRELFAGKPFISTGDLIARLRNRVEEPWAEYNHGRPINPERLAGLLREFGIRSSRIGTTIKQTGYHAADFRDAWARYLPPHPPENPGNPGNPVPRPRPPGYDAMIRTPRWANFSRKVREHWGNRCVICNADGPLHVHHRTYDRLGREEMTDVIPVCQGPCHEFADRRRREAKR